MISALVIVGLFGIVAFAAFAVCRMSARIELEHERELGRLLHPTSSSASVIDQAAGESVRIVSDELDPPFDWSEELDDE